MQVLVPVLVSVHYLIMLYHMYGSAIIISFFLPFHGQLKIESIIQTWNGIIQERNYHKLAKGKNYERFLYNPLSLQMPLTFLINSACVQGTALNIPYLHWKQHAGIITIRIRGSQENARKQ